MGTHNPRTSQSVLRRCLFTLYVFVSLVSVTRAQAPSGDVQCNTAPPGVVKIFKGVDITSLDLLPTDFTADDGFKSPVLNLTCNQQNRVYVRGDKRYQMPDQVWLITDNPSGWITSDVHLYRTSKDIRTSMSSDVGGSGPIWKFSFSASMSYTKMQNTIINSTRYISDVASFHSSTRVDMKPDLLLQLNWIAQMYVEKLEGKSYQTHPQDYQEFIDEFGTHYFSMANFGGLIHAVYETSTSYFSSHTDQQVKLNARASFYNLISVHGGIVMGSTNVESQFTANSTATTRYYGGSTNLLSSDGITTWQPTIDGKPWLFSGNLKPISDLLEEPMKSSMEEAVLQHVMKEYLKELRRLLNTVTSKMVSSTTTDQLRNRLAAMEALDLGALVEADVESLDEDINHQLVAPFWFRTNTQLCFKWWPEGDEGQCGGGAGRKLCARPGGMTLAYLDDTDDRRGGCRMQWSIQSSGFGSDPWFSQVQMCYRWHPDGDGGQCGGGTARELCARVNQWSPQYTDDTDRRGGGCQMSWRIVVPNSAPMWMKKTKLCFSWYPDGDGLQCGPAHSRSRNMCATANQWTPYYLDDTHFRKGGCRMSWGLRLGF